MSQPIASIPLGHAPAGWYADPWGRAASRWWDGMGWTAATWDATHAQYDAYRRTLVQPPLPAGTPAYGAFIWALALLPLVAIASALLWPEQYLGYEEATPPGRGESIPNPLLTIRPFALLWILAYAAGVVFAALDARWLRRRGHLRPFHWAFAFIPIIGVYVIGRSVRVHSVLRRGLAPIWVWAGLEFAFVVLDVVFLVGAAASSVAFAA